MSDKMTGPVNYQTERVEAYVAHVRARALDASRDEIRADVAAQEARAQATGAYGPHGVAAFRAFLVETGRIDAKHIVAQACEISGPDGSRAWSRWSDGTTTRCDSTYDRGLYRQGRHIEDSPPAGLKWVDTVTLLPIGEQAA